MRPSAGVSEGVERVERVEAVLLTRQWFDRRDGVELTFWGASRQGPIKVVCTRQPAVMFVDRQTPTQAGRRKNVELASLVQRPVDAVYFASQRDLVAERHRIHEQAGVTLEATVKPHDRYLMERFVTGAFAAEGRFVDRGGYREVVDPKIRGCELTVPLTRMCLDIETDGFDGPLLSIAVAGDGGERVWIRAREDGDGRSAGDVHTWVPDERALLRAFIDHVTAVDPRCAARVERRRLRPRLPAAPLDSARRTAHPRARGGSRDRAAADDRQRPAHRSRRRASGPRWHRHAQGRDFLVRELPVAGRGRVPARPR